MTATKNEKKLGVVAVSALLLALRGGGNRGSQSAAGGSSSGGGSSTLLPGAGMVNNTTVNPGGTTVNQSLAALWGGIQTPIDVNALTIDIYGRITGYSTRQRDGYRVTISSILDSGLLLQNEYAGPNSSSSSAVLLGVGATGFSRIAQAGTLEEFSWSTGQAPASNITVEIWRATADDPTTFAPTGVLITMSTGTYGASSVQTLTVAVGDLLVCRSGGPGYAPWGMEITARLIPV